MDRVLLCANPAASGFTGGIHRDVLARLRSCFDVEAEWPKTPADTRSISRQAAEDAAHAVVAMGGDGVVHHVANGIGSTDTALGIIPVGTTNVLARLLGIPSRASGAADYICSAPDVRPSPSARVRLSTDDGDVHRLATFSVGIGFDAEVVEVAEKEPYRKYRFGGVHYARSAASVVWSGYPTKQPTLRITDGERSAEGVAAMVQLHPTYTYFGRVPLRFGTHQPGTATVLVARQLERRRIAAILRGAVTGRNLDKVDGMEVWEGVTSLTVETDTSDVPAQADGELLGLPSRMDMQVETDALHVLAPGRRSRRN